MRKVLRVIGSLAVIGVAGPALGQGMTGDAREGAEIAERWCAACHLVSEDQARAPVDAPTFLSIAERTPEAIDALAGFLMDPHPPMPDLSLTRAEIRDLLAYIESLRTE
ncbi:cytochrome c [Pararhodobacter sp. SW119]|uniref:c-type cytochrome n=1 Tax=Pararhodobacter sp. SW119 TaxID=2780075 RepID=UPI001AE0829C|nr:cytochrome c [Pararhodobacter sp. SW119]